MAQRESMLQSCIADLNSGVFTSVKQAAAAYGLPRSTLRRRLAGVATRSISHQQYQRLSPEQEDFLVQWILDEDALA